MLAERVLVPQVQARLTFKTSQAAYAQQLLSDVHKETGELSPKRSNAGGHVNMSHLKRESLTESIESASYARLGTRFQRAYLGRLARTFHGGFGNQSGAGEAD